MFLVTGRFFWPIGEGRKIFRGKMGNRYLNFDNAEMADSTCVLRVVGRIGRLILFIASCYFHFL